MSEPYSAGRRRLLGLFAMCCANAGLCRSSTTIEIKSSEAQPAAQRENRPQQNLELTTACEIAELVRSRRVSAVEVLEIYLARIEATNGLLNAFVFVDPDAARKVAQSIDARISQGQDPGSLAGVPFAVKDLDDCLGMPTSLGSLLFKNGPRSNVDSPHVSRARAAGAVIVGKTATPEFGWLSITASKAWGITRNPWNSTLSPGGSSGGSAAAIASGMIPLATGSDSGGSIRSPAAFTGLVGLKPSFGRVGQIGIGDRQVSGCLSLDVRDTARFLDIAGRPALFDRSSLPPVSYSYEKVIETLDVRGLKAAWSPDFGYIPTEKECIEIAGEAAHRLAGEARLALIDRKVNLPKHWRVPVRPVTGIRRGVLELDGLWPSREEDLTPEVRDAFSKAGEFTATDLAAAQRATQELFAAAEELFEEVDVLLAPVTTVTSLPAEGPVPSVIAGRDATTTGAEAHLRLANLAWLPAISVPAGLSSTGFPVGLQIIGARWRDDVVLRLARIWEMVRPWPLGAPQYRRLLKPLAGGEPIGGVSASPSLRK